MKNDVPYADHPQFAAPKGKSIHLTSEMHQKLIDEGVAIMEKVNISLDAAHKPFTVLGTFRESAPKSFWMKVKCFYCRDLLSLCPPKKNLEWNLQHHLASAKVLHVVEQSQVVSKRPTAILSGRRGRPTLSSRVSVHSNQPDLGKWWKIGSSTTDMEGGEASNFDQDSCLHLMCWGFRGPTCKYFGVLYSVRELLDDPHVGGVWYVEPHLTTYVNVNGGSININSTFRHMLCLRVDPSGSGFFNLACSMCSAIPLENDLKKKIFAKSVTLIKGGLALGEGEGLDIYKFLNCQA